jgi:hypothetical protein
VPVTGAGAASLAAGAAALAAGADAASLLLEPQPASPSVMSMAALAAHAMLRDLSFIPFLSMRGWDSLCASSVNRCFSWD